MHIPQILKENKEQKFVEIKKIKQIPNKKKGKQDTQQWHKNLTKRNPLKKSIPIQINQFQTMHIPQILQENKEKQMFDKIGIQKKEASKQRLINVKPRIFHKFDKKAK